MIGNGRLSFVDPSLWLDSGREFVEVMYPPSVVFALVYADTGPGPQPAVTDAAVQAFGEVLLEHGYDQSELYELAGMTPVRETIRAALAAAFAEVGL